MEQRFGYGLEELARRFDRSLSWVSRRLGLVEQLPESVQQQVRSGAISAQVAMKFLVPVSRSSLEDCRRMAEAMATHRFTSREAGQWYAAWRDAAPAVRQRLLEQPQLFLKMQRSAAAAKADPPTTGVAELLRDLDVVLAMARRANRRLAGATVEVDRPQGIEAQSKIERVRQELNRLAAKIPLPQAQEQEHVEPSTTDHDSGTEWAGREQARDCAGAEGQPADGAQGPALELDGRCRRCCVRRKPNRYRQQVLELMTTCKGNLVRVREELAASGVNLSYSTLTAFCHRHGIGQPPVVAAGRYEFQPGEELQHDTSPHEVLLGGKRRKVQTASAVLAYSRMLFFQMYPTFQRFDCKVFLTEALRYFNGAPQRVMIDNTHVVVLRGTGREMVPVPEMAAFAERFGFRFVAHERGDANRSARVERNFWFIESNFLAGRTLRQLART